MKISNWNILFGTAQVHSSCCSHSYWAQSTLHLMPFELIGVFCTKTLPGFLPFDDAIIIWKGWVDRISVQWNYVMLIVEWWTHYIFVQTHRMCRTRNESWCKLKTLRIKMCWNRSSRVVTNNTPLCLRVMMLGGTVCLMGRGWMQDLTLVSIVENVKWSRIKCIKQTTSSRGLG